MSRSNIFIDLPPLETTEETLGIATNDKQQQNAELQKIFSSAHNDAKIRSNENSRKKNEKKGYAGNAFNYRKSILYSLHGRPKFHQFLKTNFLQSRIPEGQSSHVSHTGVSTQQKRASDVPVHDAKEKYDIQSTALSFAKAKPENKLLEKHYKELPKPCESIPHKTRVKKVMKNGCLVTVTPKVIKPKECQDHEKLEDQGNNDKDKITGIKNVVVKNVQDGVINNQEKQTTSVKCQGDTKEKEVPYKTDSQANDIDNQSYIDERKNKDEIHGKEGLEKFDMIISESKSNSFLIAENKGPVIENSSDKTYVQQTIVTTVNQLPSQKHNQSEAIPIKDKENDASVFKNEKRNDKKEETQNNIALGSVLSANVKRDEKPCEISSKDEQRVTDCTGSSSLEEHEHMLEMNESKELKVGGNTKSENTSLSGDDHLKCDIGSIKKKSENSDCSNTNEQMIDKHQNVELKTNNSEISCKPSDAVEESRLKENLITPYEESPVKKTSRKNTVWVAAGEPLSKEGSGTDLEIDEVLLSNDSDNCTKKIKKRKDNEENIKEQEEDSQGSSLRNRPRKKLKCYDDLWDENSEICNEIESNAQQPMINMQPRHTGSLGLQYEESKRVSSNFRNDINRTMVVKNTSENFVASDEKTPNRKQVNRKKGECVERKDICNDNYQQSSGHNLRKRSSKKICYNEDVLIKKQMTTEEINRPTNHDELSCDVHQKGAGKSMNSQQVSSLLSLVMSDLPDATVAGGEISEGMSRVFNGVRFCIYLKDHKMI